MPNRNDAVQLTDNFIEKWADGIMPEMAFTAKNREQFIVWKERLTKKVRELLGEMPEPSDLSPVKVVSEERENYIREKYIIQTEKDCFMPLYILIPKNGAKKHPAILCCHGHGPYGKDPVAGAVNGNVEIRGLINAHNYNYGEQMAEKGFIAICPDWRSFGERIGYNNPFAPRDICNVHFIQHLILGRTLLGANVFDGMRAIDFLLTRDDVDADNIGCMGLSFGGTMATYMMLLEPRIKAGDIICYATTTKHYAVSRANFCGSQLVPNLYKYADVGDVIGAICPKPLLLESGANDNCFWLHSALEAHEKVSAAYEAAGERDKLQIEIFPGAHAFSGRMAFKFFARYLKNEKNA